MYNIYIYMCNCRTEVAFLNVLKTSIWENQRFNISNVLLSAMKCNLNQGLEFQLKIPTIIKTQILFFFYLRLFNDDLQSIQLVY